MAVFLRGLLPRVCWHQERGRGLVFGLLLLRDTCFESDQSQNQLRTMLNLQPCFMDFFYNFRADKNVPRRCHCKWFITRSHLKWHSIDFTLGVQFERWGRFRGRKGLIKGLGCIVGNAGCLESKSLNIWNPPQKTTFLDRPFQTGFRTGTCVVVEVRSPTSWLWLLDFCSQTDDWTQIMCAGTQLLEPLTVERVCVGVFIQSIPELM